MVARFEVKKSASKIVFQYLVWKHCEITTSSGMTSFKQVEKTNGKKLW